jgi:hypothetical protein
MTKNKDNNNLLELLSIVAGMELFFGAQHSGQEILAMGSAMKAFKLTWDEVALLARLFFDDNGMGDPVSGILEIASDRDINRLIRYGYAERSELGGLRVTIAARRAIEAGDPYIIDMDDEIENTEFFSHLATAVKSEFTGEEASLPVTIWDGMREYPRASFVIRFHERYDSLPNEERELLLALCSHFQLSGPVVWTLPSNLASIEKAKGRQLLSHLVEKGLAVTVAPEGDPDARKGNHAPVMLAPDVAGFLFKGLGRILNLGGPLSRYGTLLQAEDVMERALFYNDDIAQEVRRLFRAYSQDALKRIMDRLEKRGTHRGMSCLLYGPPGTGKTELAMQLARTSGRAIVKADVAKLTGSYVGESERNYRGLFTVYRYAAAILDPAPVLLLNEADTFIAPRVMVRQSNDKYENNIVNILLEELESLEGLLVATTNNPGKMDPAFERRFFMKLEVGLPDAATRYRIWHDKMPELPKDVAERLATRFKLTGAGIENVIARFDMLDILDDRKPGYNDLNELCGQAEKQIVGGIRRTVGYQTSI